MAEHEEGFTPEMLDEQLEHPLDSLSPVEARLVDELHRHHHDTWERSAAVLDHAWERVMQNQSLHDQKHQSRHTPAFAQRNRPLERISSMQKKQKNRLTVFFGTFAAILLIAFMVVGLVIVQQNQHTQVGSSIPNKATASPTPVRVFGKTIYTASGSWGEDISWSPDSTRIASLNNG
jgi:hypothetical protein